MIQGSSWAVCYTEWTADPYLRTTTTCTRGSPQRPDTGSHGGTPQDSRTTRLYCTSAGGTKFNSLVRLSALSGPLAECEMQLLDRASESMR